VVDVSSRFGVAVAIDLKPIAALGWLGGGVRADALARALLGAERDAVRVADVRAALSRGGSAHDDS
jgi:hypothetical protein